MVAINKYLLNAHYVPGLVLDGFLPACLNFAPHTDDFPHLKWTNVKTQEKLQGVFICTALRCGSLSPGYVTSQLENYSRLTYLRKCSNLHQFWKKCLQTVSFFVVILECLYHKQAEWSPFSGTSSVRDGFASVGSLETPEYQTVVSETLGPGTGM